ncbi:hypothetical protein MPOCJGCO_2094 [Methylobacterium trifolii]|uniref:Uncharacterized protein n=1 Tax=Methylobacterium trifolii TaxID=1003092 RepID=A0ABQ4U1K7_9HYPH|nr:hypothetical protein MPOCJGCO_2094 [Methylobacterium trifolii]
MLAQHRRGCGGRWAGIVEADGAREVGHGPGGRMREGADHVALRELGSLADLAHRADGAAGDAVRPEERGPVLPRAAGEDRLQDGLEFLAPRRALGGAGEPAVGAQVLPVQRRAEQAPEPVVGDADVDPAVGGGERLVGADRGMRVAAPLRAGAGGEVHAGVEGQQGGHGVEHGHVDAAALPRALALPQGRQHALRRVEPGHEVGDRGADLRRRPVRVAGDVHDAGFALEDQVVARPVRVRSGQAEARDAAIDQAGIVLPQPLEAEAEPVHRPGPEVLDHHVGGGGQPQDQVPAGRRLEVDGAALLVPVDRQEVGALAAEEGRPVGARLVAPSRLLDLDHVGAEIAELHRREGAGDHPAEVEDSHACQGRGVRPWHPQDPSSCGRGCRADGGFPRTASGGGR